MDKQIKRLIKQEKKRQSKGLELIASENYPSSDVMKLCSSVFMCKYAEGYPYKRYYGGCDNVDRLEQGCIDAVCELFGCKYANVQPHSGSQANAAAYKALEKYLKANSKLEDRKMRILTVKLNDGGHLTHGSPVSFSSEYYDFFFYDLDPQGKIDFNIVESAIIKNKPDVILAGYSAYPYEVRFDQFYSLAKKYGCLLMADIAHIAGMCTVNTKTILQDPIKYCDIITTTTHKTLRGPRGGLIMTNNEKLIKLVNSAVFPYYQGGPFENVIAAKYQMAIEDNTNDYTKYIEQVKINAATMSKRLFDLGCAVSSTDNHLFLLNTKKSFGLTGKEAQEKLEAIGITTNKNMLPGDDEKPSVTSGLRIGLPALTTRGLDALGATDIANLIYNYLSGKISQCEAIHDVKTIIKVQLLKKIK